MFANGVENPGSKLRLPCLNFWYACPPAWTRSGLEHGSGGAVSVRTTDVASYQRGHSRKLVGSDSIDSYTCMDSETETVNDVKATELTSWQVHACCQLIQRDAQHEHVSFLEICGLSIQHL